MPELTSQDRKRSRQRGRNAEYRCARDMGGVVVGRSKAVKVGDRYVQVNCQKPPDVLAGFFSFEVTNRKIPKAISNKMRQAIANCPEGFEPFVWWFDRESDTTYVITTRPTFLALHGKGG